MSFSQSLFQAITPAALFMNNQEHFQSYGNEVVVYSNYDNLFVTFIKMILMVVILYYAIILTYDCENNTLPTLPLVLAIIFPLPTILFRLIVCHKTIQTIANVVNSIPPVKS